MGVVVRGGGGLGISLEGTVDVEGGREVRPHHYVRSVLPEGPVGRARVHRPGDELLGAYCCTGGLAWQRSVSITGVSC